MATDNVPPVPEMVERGARVLCEARRGQQCQRRSFYMSDEDCAACDFAVQCHTQSIWFIQAMSEPTEAMIDAGMTVLLPQTKPHAKEMEPICRQDAETAWRAMVAAALGR